MKLTVLLQAMRATLHRAHREAQLPGHGRVGEPLCPQGDECVLLGGGHGRRPRRAGALAGAVLGVCRSAASSRASMWEPG